MALNQADTFRELVERVKGLEAENAAVIQKVAAAQQSAFNSGLEEVAKIADGLEQQASINETEFDSIGESCLIPNVKYWEGQRVAADEISKAARALIGTPPQHNQQWQSIESAPKDGTLVLLVWHWDSGIHKGVTVIAERWYCRAHAHLSFHKNCPNEADCKMGWGAYSGEFSHWMSLPTPPEQPKEQK